MYNKPHTLTEAEVKEIAAMAAIQQMWGAENANEMEKILDADVYAVKFNYHSGSPGYVGDYFILQGDALGEALELVRDKHGDLVFVDAATL